MNDGDEGAITGEEGGGEVALLLMSRLLGGLTEEGALASGSG